MKFLDGDGLAQVWAKIKDTFAYKTDIKASNWNASEGEDGYIENRTHYKIFGDASSFTNDNSITFALDNEHAHGYAYGFNDYPEGFIDLMEEGNYISLTIGSTKFEGAWKQEGSSYWIGNRSIRTPDAEDTGEDFYIGTNSKGFDNLHMYLDPSFVGEYQADDLSFEEADISYVQLDEKYIPSTIARTTDIPTTDQTYNNLSQNPQSGTAVASAIANVTSLIPTKTSDLTNDGVGGSPADPFITKTVDNLTNYYDKSDIDGMISVRLKIQVVDTLPIQDIDTSTIYLVLAAGSPSDDNTYEEYIYIIDEEGSSIEGHWEMIGTSEVDLTDYMQKSENLNDVADRQTALNNLTNASVSHAGEYLKVNEIGNVTFGTVAAQSQADWNQNDNTQVDYIKNKPTVKIGSDAAETLESIEVTKSEVIANNDRYWNLTITANGNKTLTTVVPEVDQNFNKPASRAAISTAAVNGALAGKIDASDFATFKKTVILKDGYVEPTDGGGSQTPLAVVTTENNVNLWVTVPNSTSYEIKQDSGTKSNFWAAVDIHDIEEVYVSGNFEKVRYCLTDGVGTNQIIFNSAQDVIDFIDSKTTTVTGTATYTRLSCSFAENLNTTKSWNRHKIENTSNNKLLIMYFGNALNSLEVTAASLEPAFLDTIDQTSVNAVQSNVLYSEFAKYTKTADLPAVPSKTSDLTNDGEGGSPASRYVEEWELEATTADLDYIMGENS